MTELIRVTFGLPELHRKSKLPPNNPFSTLIEGAIAALDETTRAKIEAAGQCTVVYHGCGTCENGGALVEYFCGAGGGEPDYTRCESCD